MRGRNTLVVLCIVISTIFVGTSCASNSIPSMSINNSNTIVTKDSNNKNNSQYNDINLNEDIYSEDGFDEEGYDINGYDKRGYNRYGFDKTGFDINGFDKNGINKQGFTKNELDENGNPLIESFGLGLEQTERVSNNRPYDWYIDQANTGDHKGDNCGPSSVTMAIKWVNSSFSKTAEDARNTYRSEGGWWYTSDITNYLDDNNIENRTVPFPSEEKMKEQLKNGNILILCINTSYLNENYKYNQRVGRFYSYSDGHFLVVKGYRVVDDKLYFETYDSNNWNKTYEDRSPKGKDRYYIADELLNSMKNHWNSFIVVYPNN